ncbi:hypothetical protein GCM10027168_48400 [Streptomyces capparidis]
MTTSMAAALEAAAAAGPFFAVRAAPPGAGRGLRPFAEDHRHPGRLARHIASVGARLRHDETRVAASVAFQGLAGRLWSVALGPAALTGLVPDLDPARLHWDPDGAAPDDLWLPRPAARPGAPGGTAAALRAAVLDAHLLPLHRAVRQVCPVAPGLLWGNAASALVGSAWVLGGWCRGTGRPRAADRAVALTRALLAEPELRGTGALLPGPVFRRRSCCLYYRVPGGALCGDCGLRRDRPEGRARRAVE